MVSSAVLAEILATSRTAAERDVELSMLRLALEAKDRRIQELEGERSRWLEERAGLLGQVERLSAEQDRLQRQVEELSRRARLDSTNSSKPPSSDGLRRRPRPSSPERKCRKEKGRRPGKQKGAPGFRLAPAAVPDKVEDLLPAHCGKCLVSLAGAAPAEGRSESRQVWDLPPPSGLVRTEYRAITLVCPDCGEQTKAEFPQWAKAPVSYGPRLHAMVSYLGVGQLLPFKRMAQALHDIYGADISEGTLAAMIARGGERVQPAVEEIQRQLRAEPVVHFDETGAHVGGRLAWVHGAATDQLTLLGIDGHRGGSGIAALGVAPELTGIAVHDHWSSYWGDALPKVSGHALCNAHHIRELTDVCDFYGQRWAERMINLLIEMLAARNQAMDRGQAALDPELVKQFEGRYDNILKEGWKANPRRPGRAQRSRPGNLLRRLDEHRAEVLRFLHDFRVPFTNNEIERDLRMVKLHEKVSGGWRSDDGARAFLRVRSYLATARKQGQGMLEVLAQVFEGRPWLPASSGP